jgi:hypothetical protein
MSNKSRTIAIALFVTALAILVGTLSSSWFTASRGDGGVGLAGIKACEDGMCRTIGWGDIPRSPTELSLFGYVGLIGGVLIAIACAITGGLLLSGKIRQFKVKPFNAVVGVGAGFQVAFLNRIWLGENMRGLSIGWAGFLSLIGILAAVIIVKSQVMPLVTAAPTAPPPAPAPQPYTVA